MFRQRAKSSGTRSGGILMFFVAANCILSMEKTVIVVDAQG